MAAKPGILTDWPWAGIGNFKVYSSYYHFMVKNCRDGATRTSNFDPNLVYLLRNPVNMYINKYQNP